MSINLIRGFSGEEIAYEERRDPIEITEEIRRARLQRTFLAHPKSNNFIREGNESVFYLHAVLQVRT